MTDSEGNQPHDDDDVGSGVPFTCERCGKLFPDEVLRVLTPTGPVDVCMDCAEEDPEGLGLRPTSGWPPAASSEQRSSAELMAEYTEAVKQVHAGAPARQKCQMCNTSTERWVRAVSSIGETRSFETGTTCLDCFVGDASLERSVFNHSPYLVIAGPADRLMEIADDLAGAYPAELSGRKQADVVTELIRDAVESGQMKLAPRLEPVDVVEASAPGRWGALRVSIDPWHLKSAEAPISVNDPIAVDPDMLASAANPHLVVGGGLTATPGLETTDVAEAVAARYPDVKVWLGRRLPSDAWHYHEEDDAKCSQCGTRTQDFLGIEPLGQVVCADCVLAGGAWPLIAQTAGMRYDAGSLPTKVRKRLAALLEKSSPAQLFNEVWELGNVDESASEYTVRASVIAQREGALLMSSDRILDMLERCSPFPAFTPLTEPFTVTRGDDGSLEFTWSTIVGDTGGDVYAALYRLVGLDRPPSSKWGLWYGLTDDSGVVVVSPTRFSEMKVLWWKPMGDYDPLPTLVVHHLT